MESTVFIYIYFLMYWLYIIFVVYIHQIYIIFNGHDEMRNPGNAYAAAGIRMLTIRNVRIGI